MKMSLDQKMLKKFFLVFALSLIALINFGEKNAFSRSYEDVDDLFEQMTREFCRRVCMPPPIVSMCRSLGYETCLNDEAAFSSSDENYSENSYDRENSSDIDYRKGYSRSVTSAAINSERALSILKKKQSFQLWTLAKKLRINNRAKIFERNRNFYEFLRFNDDGRVFRFYSVGLTGSSDYYFDQREFNEMIEYNPITNFVSYRNYEIFSTLKGRDDSEPIKILLRLRERETFADLARYLRLNWQIAHRRQTSIVEPSISDIAHLIDNGYFNDEQTAFYSDAFSRTLRNGISKLLRIEASDSKIVYFVFLDDGSIEIDSIGAANIASQVFLNRVYDQFLTDTDSNHHYVVFSLFDFDEKESSINFLDYRNTTIIENEVSDYYVNDVEVFNHQLIILTRAVSDLEQHIFYYDIDSTHHLRNRREIPLSRFDNEEVVDIESSLDYVFFLTESGRIFYTRNFSNFERITTIQSLEISCLNDLNVCLAIVNDDLRRRIKLIEINPNARIIDIRNGPLANNNEIPIKIFSDRERRGFHVLALSPNN